MRVLEIGPKGASPLEPGHGTYTRLGPCAFRCMYFFIFFIGKQRLFSFLTY